MEGTRDEGQGTRDKGRGTRTAAPLITCSVGPPCPTRLRMGASHPRSAGNTECRRTNVETAGGQASSWWSVRAAHSVITLSLYHLITASRGGYAYDWPTRGTRDKGRGTRRTGRKPFPPSHVPTFPPSASRGRLAPIGQRVGQRRPTLQGGADGPPCPFVPSCLRAFVPYPSPLVPRSCALPFVASSLRRFVAFPRPLPLCPAPSSLRPVCPCELTCHDATVG